MKAQQLRELSAAELAEKIEGLEEEHFNLRFQARMGQLGNPLQLRMVRRDIARAYTILAEKKRENALS
jgi:large subunit ribosomal protein L29